MPNSIDLQIQSTASDGKHTPTELVHMAKERGITVIAITDHDTVGGVAEAQKAGEGLGVRVIPGIEMSVEEGGSHILGYGIDIGSSKLTEELARFRQGRITGAQKMVENLQKAGFFIEWEDVLREAKGVVARPHIARALLARPENKEKLGSVTTVHDVFEHILADDGPYYVPRSHISAKDAITLLHNCGGVAVWSHPALRFREDYEALEKFLQELATWGIDGLEVFNPSHTEDDAEFIQGMAIKYRLLRTAGSDFHAKNESPLNAGGLRPAQTVGDYETFGFSTEDIILRLDEAISKYMNTSI